MSIKESTSKKNYSNKSDKNKKVASASDFYIRNIIRDITSKKIKIKKIKPSYLKGRELSTNFKKKT